MDKVKVVVMARSGVVWSGEGTSCSMVNTLGPLDILAEHTQFVTPIKDKVTVRDGQVVVWEQDLSAPALCRVKANVVEIWVGV